MKTKIHGFTLIEVMIVVAIVGILAAIAIPSYTESVRRGARADARASILTVMQQQERFFTQNNTYAAFPNTAQAAGFKNYSGDAGYATARWVLSAAACGGSTLANCVVITAVPQVAASDTVVTSIAFTSGGAANCLPASVPVAQCWPR